MAKKKTKPAFRHYLDIVKERNVKMVEMEVNMPDETHALLLKQAREFLPEDKLVSAYITHCFSEYAKAHFGK